MKLPITLIIEQERRRREEAEANRPRIELPLRHIEAPRPPARNESTFDIGGPDDEDDDDRGVTIINIFGDDEDDDDYDY